MRLRPAPHCRTRILSYALKVEPEEHFINWQQDPQGNYLARLVFPEKTTGSSRSTWSPRWRCSIRSTFSSSPTPRNFRSPTPSSLSHELSPYLEGSAAADAHVPGLPGRHRPYAAATIDFLVALNQRLQQDIGYLIRLEPGVQTPEQTLELGSGSCRDSRLAAGAGAAPPRTGGALRLGLPDPAHARREAARRPRRQPKSTSPTCTPGARSTCPAPAGSASTRPRACSPARGTFRSPARREPSAPRRSRGRRQMRSRVCARDDASTRIYESPRVTKPYTEEQWAGSTPGQAVDADLLDGDVRLTMGGEPTFVSADDGRRRVEHRCARADKRRLADRTLPASARGIWPGGFVHYGQGKWYPGEPLPRWALRLLLAQGRPAVWQDPSLLRRRGDLRRQRRRAQRFIAALTRTLGARRRCIDAGLRGRLVLPVARAPPAGQRRSVESAWTTRGARAARAGVRAGPRAASSATCCRSPPRDPGRRPRWETGPWYFRAERMLPDPGRFADGLPPAAGFAAVGHESDYPYSSIPDPLAPRPLRRRALAHAVRRGWRAAARRHGREAMNAPARGRDAVAARRRGFRRNADIACRPGPAHQPFADPQPHESAPG